jgi:hypothetical protein
MERNESLDSNLAVALQASLRRACPRAFVGGDTSDVVAWEAITIDGRFKLRLVAKHLIEELRRRGIELAVNSTEHADDD